MSEKLVVEDWVLRKAIQENCDKLGNGNCPLDANGEFDCLKCVPGTALFVPLTLAQERAGNEEGWCVCDKTKLTALCLAYSSSEEMAYEIFLELTTVPAKQKSKRFEGFEERVRTTGLIPTKIMDRDCYFKVGDWVRFYRDDEMVVGVVQYIRNPVVGQEYTLQTDKGEVSESLVIEARKKEPGCE